MAERITMSNKDERLSHAEEEAQLIASLVQDVVKNEQNHKYLIATSMKSKIRGFNPVEWAGVAQAACEAYYNHTDDDRVISDRFAFLVAMELSEFYAMSIRNLERKPN